MIEVFKPLAAPFPYFGGKRRVAQLVWEHFGDDCNNYVEPFFGSGAVLLGRPPGFRGSEVVNDKDCYLANFWRALKSDPDGVCDHCDWPVNEADLHARHRWLLDQETFRKRMRTEPSFYDVQIAGWWVWGACQWIAGGWCEKRNYNNHACQARPDLGSDGRGVHRAPQSKPHLSNSGCGVHRESNFVDLREYLAHLSVRLRRVKVCCKDWQRICTPAALGLGRKNCIAVFLDPPYNTERDLRCYATDDHLVSADVREWAIEHGNDSRLRICLCGYDTEHDMPSDWTQIAWKTQGGYANKSKNKTQGKDNAGRERLWFSPHCLRI